MKIPLYILGLFKRHGPLYGYQLKKIIDDNLSDFTQIKLPNIYYHLEKMEREGLLSMYLDKRISGNEKTVYSLSEKGELKFIELLNQFLNFNYQSSFDSDTVFFFSDSLPKKSVQNSLINYRNKLIKSINTFKIHRDEMINFIPEESQQSALIIFNHHEKHYQAELDWVEESLTNWI
jgi:DNA-binding PadR family transcriptional regulator